MRVRSTAGCVAAATMALLGCGSGSLPSETGTITFPSALTCAASGWTVLHSFGFQSLVPGTLRLRDGLLYTSIGELGIVSVATTGGEPTVVTPDFGAKLWLEGDSIFYAKMDDKLWQVPLAGGTPALVLDGMTTFVGPSYGAAADTALDASYFYWDLSSQEGPRTWTVWRQARAGGAAEKLADLPPPDPASSWRTLTLSGDTLLAAVDNVDRVYAISLSGGNMRTLASPPAAAADSDIYLVGSSPAGVLWVNDGWPANDGSPTTTLSFTDASDLRATTARPFWQSKPPSLRPLSIGTWADGESGWIVTGSETLADGSIHPSVWAVDAAGTGGARLGCDPRPGFGGVLTAVSSPDAVYAIVDSGGTAEPDEFVLVRMDRASAAPAIP